jgi:hypothetical protein
MTVFSIGFSAASVEQQMVSNVCFIYYSNLSMSSFAALLYLVSGLDNGVYRRIKQMSYVDVHQKMANGVLPW